MIAAVADTHVIVWFIYADPRLSVNATNFMREAAKRGDQIAISSMTLIEMVYLIEKGRIAAEAFTRLASVLDSQPTLFIAIPLSLQTARALQRIPVDQVPDLPDRVIAATTLQLNAPVISRDGKIRLSIVPTVW